MKVSYTYRLAILCTCVEHAITLHVHVHAHVWYSRHSEVINNLVSASPLKISEC